MPVNFSALIFKSMDAAFIFAGIILGAAVLILIIDLDTKKRLLEESLSLKELLNDGRIQAATSKGSHPNGSDNSNSPRNMVADGATGMAEESASKTSNRTSKTTSIRERKTRANDPSISDGTSGMGA